jgi:hypothetical protein
MPKYITKITMPEDIVPLKTAELTLDLHLDMTPFQEMIQGLREAIAQNPGNEQRIYNTYRDSIYNVIEETINEGLLPYRGSIYNLVEEEIENALQPEPAVPLDPGPGLLHIRRAHPVDERFLEPVYENMYGELLTWRAREPIDNENDWFVVSTADVRYIF